MGSRHDETGWLNEQNGQLILRRGDGGRWRLETGLILGWKTRKLIGKRVRVLGIRCEFDMLDVQELEPV
ncbi:DUF5818 domain-containing protein [Sphingobium sp. Z007]|uniref:DUF5818 domain-containing protein n=1 Tax=Sphingobium sp. Z007 TaxID=627495 RepID=UPI001124F6AE|nr:DUF5818 domain-containing protein [Sphingobium sp. Z007]